MKLKTGLLTIFFTLFVVTAVFAAASDQHDSYVRRTSPSSNFNGIGLGVVSAFSFTTFVCEVTDVTYIRWDLSNVNGEVSSSTTPSEIVFTVTGPLGNTGTIGLYEVADDTWVESGINYSNAPAIGNLIASIPVPIAVGPVTFSGTNLNNYLNQESAYTGGGDSSNGDNLASMALRVDGCTAPTPNGVIFADKENITASFRPVMNLYSPTAVHLANLQATNNPYPNNTFLLGVAGLLLVSVASFVLMQRKQKRV